MSIPSRPLRLLSRLGLLLALLPGALLAQLHPSFIQPRVNLTGGSVTSIVPGSFQPVGLPDLLYLNAPTSPANTLTVTAGLLLNHQGFTNLVENQVTFPNALGAVAAVADFDNDGHTDFAFALSPSSSTAPDLCVYYGTGAIINTGSSIYPLGQRSGCLTLPNTGPRLPGFQSVAAAPFTTGGVPQLFVVDTANSVIDVIGNTQSPTSGGALTGFHIASQLPIPPADGPGPILLADINHDGLTDILLNNQASLSLTVYLGNGDGTFRAPLRIHPGDARSMLLYDVDGDHIADLVLENANASISVFRGTGDATLFASTPLGGTGAAAPALGSGGQLVAMGDLNHDGTPDLLTATPAGLSVLLGQPVTSYLGTPHGYLFQLAAIYNIGPGRQSFTLADFDGDGNLDLAVNSPQGVAIINSRSDGSFQTAPAYPTGLPALSAAVTDFNSDTRPDIAVSTGVDSAATLLGNGDGSFQPFTPSNGTVPFSSTLWSNISAADLDGDGKQDLLFAATGVPPPTSGSGLHVQFGNGDGTFASPQTSAQLSFALLAGNLAFGQAAIADLNGDGISDIAFNDASSFTTFLSTPGQGSTLGLTSVKNSALSNPRTDALSQVAAGYLLAHHTSGPQDLIFQEGPDLVPFINTGSQGQMTRESPLSGTPGSGYYEQAVAIADLDGDGNGDVIVPFHNLSSDPAHPDPSLPNLLYIWYGNGDGTFAPPVVTNLSRNFYLARVADMDNDGRPDLVLSDGYLVGILYNQGNRVLGTEQDLLAGQGINSISIADLNNDGSFDLILANGGVTLSAPVAMGLLSQSALALNPNPAPNTGGVTVLLNAITTRPVTGNLVASPRPAISQAAITLTASFTPASGVSLPTGTVQFAVNGSALGAPVSVTPGSPSVTATFTVPAGNTYSGTPTFSARYSGDTRNSPLNVYTTDAIGGSATTTSLALCIGPSASCPSSGPVQTPVYVAVLDMFYGQSFNGTAAAFSNDGSVLDPASTIGFYDAYNGAAPILLCNLGITAGSSCPLAVGTTLGTAVGTHVFTGVYAGDASHSGSTSPTVTIHVSADTTTASLSSSLNPAPQGQPVTFTTTLTGNIVPPVGIVTFLDGTTVLGTGALVPSSATSSTAIFPTSTLTPGTHPITAVYPGTQNFQGAASAILNQVIVSAVPPPPPPPPPPSSVNFSITATPSPVSLGVGNSVALTITVKQLTGTTAPVNLSCSNLPYEATCTFATTQIPAGGGSTVLLISAMAPHSCGTTTPYFVAGAGPGSRPLQAPLSGPAYPLALATLAGFALPGRRRWLRSLFALIGAAAILQTTGCGTCTDLGTRPATYTIQVSGTATSEVESTPVVLNVHL